MTYSAAKVQPPRIFLGLIGLPFLMSKSDHKSTRRFLLQMQISVKGMLEMVARRDPKPGLVCDSELVGCKFAGIRDLSLQGCKCFEPSCTGRCYHPSNGLV